MLFGLIVILIVAFTMPIGVELAAKSVLGSKIKNRVAEFGEKLFR